MSFKSTSYFPNMAWQRIVLNVGNQIKSKYDIGEIEKFQFLHKNDERDMKNSLEYIYHLRKRKRYFMLLPSKQ